jgi:hypothetical protein
VVQHRQYGDEDGEDERRDGGPNGEQANETQFQEVNSRRQLHESAGIYEPGGVDIGVVNKEKVVSECEVHEVKANGREPENEGRNARVHDGW